MPDIADFIVANLDRVERTAQTAGGLHWSAVGYHTVGTDCGPVADAWGDVRAHIVANDPAFVLSWVTALRQIVRVHGPESGMGYNPDDGSSYGYMSSVCGMCGVADEYGVTWPCLTIRVVARIFAGQPGWQEAWR